MDTFLFHRNYTRQTSGMAVNLEATNFVTYSAIHKAAGLTASWLCLVLFHCSIIPLKNVPLGVNGSCQQERPPETVLYGGRQSGGFVNSAVSPPTSTLADNNVNEPPKMRGKICCCSFTDVLTSSVRFKYSTWQLLPSTVEC